MSNPSFEASVFANDGVFSYVDMEKVFFGGGMQNALPSVPVDKLKQMLHESGFTSKQKEAIFNLAQKDVNELSSDSSSFLNFLNPMNGKNPADGIRGDGKRRSYIGKNEIALDLLGRLADTIGLCDSSLSDKARFATKDDALDGVIKIAPSGQVIITDNPSIWYVSPLDMSLMLLDAIEKNPAARKKVFDRYAAKTKLEIDYTVFGKEKEKVENELEIALIRLLKTGMKETFPRIAYKANKNFLYYNESIPQYKKYVADYEKHLETVENALESLKKDATTATKFFRELDRLSSKGMLFGGIDVDGEKVAGVPEGKRTFDILKGILESGDFNSEEHAGIRAAALLRIVDFTYTRDPFLREEAMNWLKKDEVRSGKGIESNNATNLANEINAQLIAYNEKHKDKMISTIDPNKQFGFIKDPKDPGKVIFDSDAKILKIRALLVDLPATRATVSIWKKAEDACKETDIDLMDKLERYSYDYVVRAGEIARSKTKNFTSLNDSVAGQLANLDEKYDPQKPGTWDSLDVQIAAKFARLDDIEKEINDPSSPTEQKIHAFVEEVKQFMADKKPSPTDQNGAITLRNVDNLLGGLIDDRSGVIRGGHFDFKLEFFEKDFAEIKRQQEKSDFAVIEHSLPISAAFQELVQMDSSEATFRVIEAAKEFKRKLEATPAKYDARIELEECPFKGLTYARMTKIERKDATTKDGKPYSHAVLYFEANKQEYKVITTGAETYVGRNANGELPPFSVWKDLAGIYRNLGATQMDIECDDEATYFSIACAFATLGIECSNDQVKLSPEQEEQVRKILEAAIRRDVATDYSGKDRYATRMAKSAVKTSDADVKSLRETIDNALCGEPLKENTARLEDAAFETQTRVTELAEKRPEELAEEWIKVRDAGATSTLDIVDQSETAERFANNIPSTSDILTLARLQIMVEGGKTYGIKDLGQAIAENPFTAPQYIEDKEFKAQDLIAKIESSHPDTAKAFRAGFDEHFDRSNPDAKPEAAFVAMQNTCNILKDRDVSDEDLQNFFEGEMARQKNIDESITEYHKLRDHCKGSPIVTEKLMEQVDNFNFAASYALAELRKNPNEVMNILYERGANKALQSKVSKGEKLNLQDIVDLTKVIAKEWNGTVITPQRAVETEQELSYYEVERGYKEITKKGNGIPDDNMRKVAGYAYLEASNDVLSKKPVKYVGLKEQIDFFAFSKIATLGSKIGNTSMQAAKSIDDLETITLSAKDFNACKEVLGLEKIGAARALQKEFQHYIKEGKVRS